MLKTSLSLAGSVKTSPSGSWTMPGFGCACGPTECRRTVRELDTKCSQGLEKLTASSTASKLKLKLKQAVICSHLHKFRHTFYVKAMV